MTDRKRWGTGLAVRTALLSVACGLAVWAPAPASAADSILPVSGERFVSQARNVQGHHRFARVARSASGSFVVAWTAEGVGIYARRYLSDGTANGNMFIVDQAPSAGGASVAMTASGNFIIGWTKTVGGIAQGFARTYNSDGTARTSAFAVTSGTSDHGLSGLASDSAGNFVVIWSAENGHDPDGRGVYARRYDINGNQTGTPGANSQLNVTTAGSQWAHDIAVNEAGDGVVVFSTPFGGSVVDGQTRAVRLARGTPNRTGNEIVVVSFLPYNSGGEADIADDGSFAVVYTDIKDSFVRMFDAAGNARNVAFRINQTTAEWQNDPDIAIDDAGTTGVATWEDDGLLDGSERSIQARAFDLSGPKTDEAQMNVTTFSDQVFPGIAMDPEGEFVAVWESEDPKSALNSDDDRTDVNARVFRIAATGPLPPPPPPQDPAEHSGGAAEIGPQGDLPLDLDCPIQAACSYEVAGIYSSPASPRQAATGSLSRHTFSVRGGHSRVARFPLPAAARREARLRRRLRAHLTFVARAGARSRTTTRTITVRPRQTRAVATTGGRVRVRLHFPAALRHGTATVELTRGSRVVGRRLVRVASGNTRVATVRLAAAERADLRAGRSLRLSLRLLAPPDDNPLLQLSLPGGLPRREIGSRPLTVRPPGG
jgi:hypothetical protein